MSAAATRKREFKLLRIGDLSALPDPDWLIDGLVPARGFVNLYGAPKSGKSFIALDWGLSIAIGIPWLDHEVKQSGPVVYIFAETPPELKKRVPAWCSAHDVSPLEFLMLPSRVSLTDERERERLCKLIEAADVGRDVAPALIIIDTLAKCFGGGDENATKDMSAFVDACDELRERFDCTVMVVHHTGKDRTAGSRGSIALTGAIDAQFQVTRQGKKGAIKLRNEHQRGAGEHPDMWLRLAALGNSLVVEKTTAPGAEGEAKSKKSTNRSKIVDALAHQPGMTRTEWRAAAQALGVPKTPFYNVTAEFIKEKAVVERNGKFFIRELDSSNLFHFPSPVAGPPGEGVSSDSNAA